jgi:adenylate cyclase
LAVQDKIAGQPANGEMKLRIGINLGDIIIEDDGDVLGDGVNVAARLEQMADPGGVLISGKIYDEIEGKIERVFESRGEQEVKNLARPVRVYALAGAKSPKTEPKPLPLPDKPSIAVLPFSNMSGDPEQEYFVDGVVDEIITALSRVRSLFVISRNSTFAFKGRAVEPKAVSNGLGVRYILQGGVRRAGGRVRISVQLIDPSTGGQLWSDRCEGGSDDIFDLQDRITEQVVGALQPLIRSAEIERSRRKRPESLDAYDLIMRALPSVWATERDANIEALALLERAIDLDPSYALARALAAWCHAQRIPYLWTTRPDEERKLALEMAKAAARLDSDDPFVLTVLARAHTSAHEFAPAAPLLEKALKLDPNSSWAWQASGFTKTYLDRPDEAIEDFERSMRLSPIDPLNFLARIGIGIAHFWAERYEAAADVVRAAIGERPSAHWAYRIITAAYANLDRMEEARSAFERLMAAEPGTTLSAVAQGSTPSAASPKYKAALIGGLRKLGMPE